MRKNNKIILLFILLYGTFLRLYSLGRESLCVLEVVTVDESVRSISNLVKYWASVGHFPPYFLMMHYWMKLFGKGEFIVRFPCAIFGIMCIYIMFLLGKSLYNKKTGLLASYLLAVSTINIYYSQWAEEYTMALFFTLLSFLFLSEALKRGINLLWLGYILSTLLALFSNLSTLPILICQILYVMLLWVRHKKDINFKHMFFVFTCIIVIYSPGFLFFLKPQLKNILSWLSLPSFNTIVNIFNLFGPKIYTVNPKFPIESRLIFRYIFSIALFLLCLTGAYNSFKFNKKNNVRSKENGFEAGLYLLLWLGAPIVLLFTFSYLVTPVFGPVRYVLYASCAYYLLISKGIMSLKGKARILIIVFVVFMGSLFLREYYHVEKRTNWIKICGYIKENIKDDERTAFKMNDFLPLSWVEHRMLLYYSAPRIIGINIHEDPEKIIADTPYSRTLKSVKWEWHNIEDLDFGGIWLIIAGLRDSHKDIIKMFQDKYILVEERVFYDVSLYHLRLNNSRHFY